MSSRSEQLRRYLEETSYLRGPKEKKCENFGGDYCPPKFQDGCQGITRYCSYEIPPDFNGLINKRPLVEGLVGSVKAFARQILGVDIM